MWTRAISVILALLLSGMFGLGRLPAQGQGFLVNISNTPGESRFPFPGLNGTTLAVVWEDTTPGGGTPTSPADIFMNRSVDTGGTFTVPPTNVSDTFGDSMCYDFNFVNQYFFVTWMDSTPGNYDIFLRRSVDGGASFLPIVNLSTNAGFSQCPVMGVGGGGNVYVAWTDESSGNGEVWLRRSLDAGATWFPAVNLSNSLGFSFAWSVFAFGPFVYVFWQEGNVGARDLYMRRSIDGGATFETAVNISASLGDSIRPRPVFAGPNVFIVYQDNSDGDNDVYLRISMNGGQSFGPPANLSNNASDSVNARMLISGTFVYVVWLDNGPTYDVFLRRSLSGGTKWLPAVNLSNTSGNSTAQRQALGGTWYAAIWMDTTFGTSDILARVSGDAGTTFGPVVNISNNPGESRFPVGLIVGTEGYVVWDDLTPGNREIFFARGPLAGGLSLASRSMRAPLGVGAPVGGWVEYAPERIEWCRRQTTRIAYTPCNSDGSSP